MIVKKIFETSDEVMTSVATIDAVVAVSIYLHVELVATLHESFGDFC